MSWSALALALSSLLGLLLLLRLATLNRQKLYVVFSIYLLFDLVQSLLAFMQKYTTLINVDYRVLWIGMRTVSWVLFLWLVYTLIESLLVRFPGVLRFARKLLNGVFIAALLIGALSAKPEYESLDPSGAHRSHLREALFIAFVLERMMAMVALLVLGSILVFTLWFPVRMPKNLAVFSFGFIVCFGGELIVLLVESFWVHGPSVAMSIILISLTAACYLYWLLLLSPKGELASVTVGHSWSKPDQQRLMGQQDAMNS
jgi:hypothetical protein